MRSVILKTVVAMAVCAAAPLVNAQMDLSGIKLAEPSPELPGDRAMTCAQIAAEMGEIMNKRGMKQGIASSKSKICASTKVLNQQGEERKKLAAAQQPSLVAASVVGGPAANAVVRTTQAQDAALEARQQPERNRALAGLGSGMGDMLGVMNDPRLMRLSVLAQGKQCAESMAPKQQKQAAVQADSCVDAANDAGVRHTSVSGASPPATSAGAADPFVQRGSETAKPAAQDPFAKR
jgi:hypothetical protein